MRSSKTKAFFCIVSLFLVFIVAMGVAVIPAYAETGKTAVSGKVYEFDKDSQYEISTAKKFTATDKANTYGSFSLDGKISDVSTKNGVPSYEVSDGNLNLFYTYGDTLLKADLRSWHLIDDKSNKIDGMTINSSILSGAIILQTSKDRKTWVDAKCLTNVFATTPVQTNSFYSTKDVQLINGCYYRVIVAYKTQIKVEPNKFLFITVNKYEYKKHAEVYEFYACNENAVSSTSDTSQTYSLGSKVRTEHFDGYSGKTAIDKGDSHYGWDLGNFFVRGYTDKVSNANGNVVFLKNVGDKVTLWFNLKQSINALNGNSNLSVSSDTAGYDRYFETPKMNLGRGALIIRYTDYNNVSSSPTIYTDYLVANATVGADTKVQLFEEGDYEIALDYQITNDKLVNTTAHYRIFFKFSVRNGNCMVYPFDVATKSELTNSSMTDNGFKLDFAKSRYLRINVKREVMAESADGLIEDTRFNGPAKDGAQYTDDGVYTITVSNEYTQQFTTKRIYVGTNSILKAYMTTGLSISEINNLVAQGATIADNGTITLSATQSITDQKSSNDKDSTKDKNDNGWHTYIGLIIAGVAAFVIVACIVIIAKKKKKNSIVSENDEPEDGGADR